MFKQPDFGSPFPLRLARASGHFSGIVISSALLSLWSPGPGNAATYIVNSNGVGGAGPTIQWVIDNTPLVTGDIIELDGSPFTGLGNRDVDFHGKLITIQSQSGDPTMCVIDVQGTEIDSHRGFIFHTGETSQALVQGVTITDGYVQGNPYGGDGGGILCSEASPTINNCRIVDDEAGVNSVTGAGSGGGIACESSSTPVITNCVISQCSCGSRFGGAGGGLFSDDSSSPTLQNCTIFGNGTLGQIGGGGGIACSVAHIVNCTISSNESGNDFGGGISCGAAFISGCAIVGNSSGTGGGGVSGGNTTIVGSVISGNCAVGAEGGGLDGGNFSITSCTIAGNKAATVAGGIGGIVDGGSTLTNTILWGNCSPGPGPDGDGTFTFVCCDVSPAQLSGTAIFVGTQVNADPLFCAQAACANAPTIAGDYKLQGGSPCLPSASPCGSLIGALPQGCSGPVPTKEMTWGSLKSRFK